MRLPLTARRPLLLIHLLGGVGWFGAVMAYLVLAVVGFMDADPGLARASYRAMALVAWFVVTPLSLVGLASGIVQALGTPWGLGRHWWVLLKLVMTVLSIAILILWPQSTTALWIGVAGAGLAMASLFPVVISWAERRITITGFITSCFFVGTR